MIQKVNEDCKNGIGFKPAPYLFSAAAKQTFQSVHHLIQQVIVRGFILKQKFKLAVRFPLKLYIPRHQYIFQTV